ncbi:photosystem II biosynthesis protein [Synechococcus sp. H65.1]|uniref:photosystem II biosynthesis protein n=1 Tax=unclassified Synechococcus TaxID=2626047 RepID=UPI0039C24647
MGKSSRYSKASRGRSSQAAGQVEQQPARGDRAAVIPPEVSRRMVRRILIFSGIPSTLGLSSFVVNYYLLTNHVIALPPYFTLVESLAFFGLGFLGISYGVFSASWDPEPGSLLGIGEFRRNLGIFLQQWREATSSSASSEADET